MAQIAKVTTLEQVRKSTTRQRACLRNCLNTFGYGYSPAWGDYPLPTINKSTLEESGVLWTCQMLGIPYQQPKEESPKKPKPKKKKHASKVNRNKKSNVVSLELPCRVFRDSQVPEYFWDSLTNQQVNDFQKDMQAFWKSLTQDQRQLYMYGSPAAAHHGTAHGTAQAMDGTAMDGTASGTASGLAPASLKDDQTS